MVLMSISNVPNVSNVSNFHGPNVSNSPEHNEVPENHEQPKVADPDPGAINIDALVGKALMYNITIQSVNKSPYGEMIISVKYKHMNETKNYNIGYWPKTPVSPDDLKIKLENPASPEAKTLVGIIKVKRAGGDDLKSVRSNVSPDGSVAPKFTSRICKTKNMSVARYNEAISDKLAANSEQPRNTIDQLTKTQHKLQKLLGNDSPKRVDSNTVNGGNAKNIEILEGSVNESENDIRGDGNESENDNGREVLLSRRQKQAKTDKSVGDNDKAVRFPTSKGNNSLERQDSDKGSDPDVPNYDSSSESSTDSEYDANSEGESSESVENLGGKDEASANTKTTIKYSDDSESEVEPKDPKNANPISSGDESEPVSFEVTRDLHAPSSSALGKAGKSIRKIFDNMSNPFLKLFSNQQSELDGPRQAVVIKEATPEKSFVTKTLEKFKTFVAPKPESSEEIELENLGSPRSDVQSEKELMLSFGDDSEMSEEDNIGDVRDGDDTASSSEELKEFSSLQNDNLDKLTKASTENLPANTDDKIEKSKDGFFKPLADFFRSLSTPAPIKEIWHLGGINVGASDPFDKSNQQLSINTDQSKLNLMDYFYEKIVAQYLLTPEGKMLCTKEGMVQGEVHIYGRDLKPFVKEWMDQNRGIDSDKQQTFQEFMGTEEMAPRLAALKKVRYFNDNERNETKVLIDKEAGKLTQIGLAVGYKAKTKSDENEVKSVENEVNLAKEPTKLKQGSYVFVIGNIRGEDDKPKPTLFASLKGETNKGDFVQHSAFMRGGAVLTAGMMEIDKEGNIVSITNFSGHYRPGEKEMAILLKYLVDNGCNLSKVSLKINSDIGHGLNYVLKNKLEEIRKETGIKSAIANSAIAKRLFEPGHKFEIGLKEYDAKTWYEKTGRSLLENKGGMAARAGTIVKKSFKSLGDFFLSRHTYHVGNFSHLNAPASDKNKPLDAKTSEAEDDSEKSSV
jgi:hypothetical protein